MTAPLLYTLYHPLFTFFFVWRKAENASCTVTDDPLFTSILTTGRTCYFLNKKNPIRVGTPCPTPPLTSRTVGLGRQSTCVEVESCSCIVNDLNGWYGWHSGLTSSRDENRCRANWRSQVKASYNYERNSDTISVLDASLKIEHSFIAASALGSE